MPNNHIENKRAVARAAENFLKGPKINKFFIIRTSYKVAAVGNDDVL